MRIKYYITQILSNLPLKVYVFLRETNVLFICMDKLFRLKQHSLIIVYIKAKKAVL